MKLMQSFMITFDFETYTDQSGNNYLIHLPCLPILYLIMKKIN